MDRKKWGGVRRILMFSTLGIIIFFGAVQSEASNSGIRATFPEPITVLFPSIIHMEQRPVVWRMATEYPVTSMPGEGLVIFAQEVTARTHGAIVPQLIFDTDTEFNSSQMPEAIRNGKLEVGDAFGGALGENDPLFLLSSLPFTATSVSKARRLADMSRAEYVRAFEAQGLHLLYITPWPPTGLWSRNPVETIDDLRGLFVRTYDETSAEVIKATGAFAESLSFSEAIPRLAEGEINAVLSSGDGGAGRKLWNYLPYFTAIGYAVPLSFTAVNADTWLALTREQQEAVTNAAKVTEDRQWERLNTRLAENASRMRENGVAIQNNPSPVVQMVLHEASMGAVAAWQSRVGERGDNLLKAYLAQEALTLD